MPSGECLHAWYKFYAFVEPEKLAEGWSRDRIMQSLVERGVPCSSGSCSEIYLEKAFADRGWGPASRLPVAAELGATSLMFMVHPGLSQDMLEWVTRELSEVMAQAVSSSTRCVSAK